MGVLTSPWHFAFHGKWMLLMAIILDLSINSVQGWQQPSSCLSVQSRQWENSAWKGAWGYLCIYRADDCLARSALGAGGVGMGVGSGVTCVILFSDDSICKEETEIYRYCQTPEATNWQWRCGPAKFSARWFRALSPTANCLFHNWCTATQVLAGFRVQHFRFRVQNKHTYSASLSGFINKLIHLSIWNKILKPKFHEGGHTFRNLELGNGLAQVSPHISISCKGTSQPARPGCSAHRAARAQPLLPVP